MANRAGPAGFLVLASASALFGLALGLTSVVVKKPDVKQILTICWLTALTVTIACAAAYAIGTRQARRGGRQTAFEQQLALRDFAVRSIPLGVVSVVIGLIWYIAANLGGWDAEDRAIVNIFALLGAVHVVLMLMLAISFEKRAIRSAAEEIAGVAA